MVELIIDDRTSIDVDEVIAHARGTLRAANNDDAVAEDALGTIIRLMAMFITRARHGEDEEIVDKLARFIDEGPVPTLQ